MLRILLAAALGGAVSFIILDATGSTKFGGWLTGFLIVTVLLLVATVFASVARRGNTARDEVADAIQKGQLRAALIVDREQSGILINEQPQVKITLLVDRPGTAPFLTQLREAVELIHLHEVVPGALLAVAHPHAEYENIHLVFDQTPPTPSRGLTAGAAAHAASLPRRKRTRAWGFVPLMVLAFIVGAVGAPFLATSQPLAYAQYLVGGKQGSVARLDHAVLFEPENLRQSLASVTEELGHDEVQSVFVGEVRLRVEAPIERESARVDTITVQDHRVVDRQPATTLPASHRRDTFRLSDVDWDAVLARIPEAAELAAGQGLRDHTLRAIYAQQDTSNLSRTEVWLDFHDDYTSARIHLSADGALAPAELFALLPEDEQATYFYNAERFVAASEAMLTEIGANEIVQIINYGDRLILTAYTEDAAGEGWTVRSQFREGTVFDVEDPTAARRAPEERFRLTEVDWEAHFSAIGREQQRMAESGVPGTAPTHIIVERDSLTLRGATETIARLYLRNDRDEGGYIVLRADGTAAS